MTTTPRQRIDRVLEILERQLVPYVEELLERRYQSTWQHELWQKAKANKINVRRKDSAISWDVLLALHAIDLFWREVFSYQMPKLARVHAQELKATRNARSHSGKFTHQHADRVSQTAQLLLEGAGIKDAALHGLMQTVGIFNPRGGCGKSSVTMFLADFLSTVHGKRVLLVDLDAQRASSEILAGHTTVKNRLGRGASLPGLLRKYLAGKADRHAVHDHFIERPDSQGAGGGSYLRTITMLACDRADWWDFNNGFTKAETKDSARAYQSLRQCLDLVADEFDVCLIDFPANDLGPWARCGLHATDWWLLPCLPNWAGVRDLEAASTLVGDLIHNEKVDIRPLATVLTIRQSANTGTYKRTRATLVDLAAKGYIPPLAPKETELSSRNDALNATDVTASNLNTLGKKYGTRTGPFYKEISQLSKHVLERLNLPADEVDFTTTSDALNDLLASQAEERAPKK